MEKIDNYEVNESITISEKPPSILIGTLDPISPVDDTIYDEGIIPFNQKFSNRTWFIIGFILIPLLTYILSWFMVMIAEISGNEGFIWEFFYTLSWLIWPIIWITGIIWGFTKSGSNWFSIGLISVPVVMTILLMALVILLIFAFSGLPF